MSHDQNLRTTFQYFIDDLSILYLMVTLDPLSISFTHL